MYFDNHISTLWFFSQEVFSACPLSRSGSVLNLKCCRGSASQTTVWGTLQHPQCQHSHWADASPAFSFCGTFALGVHLHFFASLFKTFLCYCLYWQNIPLSFCNSIIGSFWLDQFLIDRKVSRLLDLVDYFLMFSTFFVLI